MPLKKGQKSSTVSDRIRSLVNEYEQKGLIGKKTDRLNEDGAGGGTGSGAIAVVPGGLFGAKPTKRVLPNNPAQKIEQIKFKHPFNITGYKLAESAPKLSFLQTLITELAPSPQGGQLAAAVKSTSKFDSTEVLSKLSNSAKISDFNDKSVPFGLEDDQGNTVKVYVKAEQADEFQQTLAAEIEDVANSQMEIAELLFKLKDNFDIIHVDWGTIAEDEEEPIDPVGQEGQDQLPADDQGMDPGMEGGEGDLPPMGDEEMPMGDDAMAPPDSSGDVGSALSAVIDMLKADAEARKAEAQAKGKQAEAEQAKYAAEIASNKMRSEIDVLDMESWNKKKDQEKKEARKLAQLAKFRHEVAARATQPDMRAEYDKVNPDLDDSIEV